MPRLDRALAEQRLPHLFESWRKPALGAQHDPDFPHVRDVNAVWCRLYDSDVYDQDRNWRIENVAHNQYPFAEGYGVTQEGTYHAFSIHMGLIEASSQKVYTIRHDLPFLAAHIPGSRFACIHSAYGHDGFLIETVLLSEVVGGFLREVAPVALRAASPGRVPE